jgi:hypothetical protein
MGVLMVYKPTDITGVLNMSIANSPSDSDSLTHGAQSQRRYDRYELGEDTLQAVGGCHAIMLVMLFRFLCFIP